MTVKDLRKLIGEKIIIDGIFAWSNYHEVGRRVFYGTLIGIERITEEDVVYTFISGTKEIELNEKYYNKSWVAYTIPEYKEYQNE